MSDIIKSIKPFVAQDEEIVFKCKVFDGGALVHLLKPAPFSTFHQYAENILIQYICVKSNNVNLVGIVWDQYFDNSLKNTTKVEEVLEGR